MSVALHAIDNPVSYTQVCREVEFADDGVAFDRVVSCLERHALVIQHWETSPDELLCHLDSGDPALVYFYFEEAAHLVVCIGYTTDRQGRVESWDLYDSQALSGGDGRRQLSHEEFCRRAQRRHARSDPLNCRSPTIDCWLAVRSNPLQTVMRDLMRQLSSSPRESPRKSDQPSSFLEVLAKRHNHEN